MLIQVIFFCEYYVLEADFCCFCPFSWFLLHTNFRILTFSMYMNKLYTLKGVKNVCKWSFFGHVGPHDDV